jgi:hypothetical protein
MAYMPVKISGTWNRHLTGSDVSILSAYLKTKIAPWAARHHDPN